MPRITRVKNAKKTADRLLCKVGSIQATRLVMDIVWSGIREGQRTNHAMRILHFLDLGVDDLATDRLLFWADSECGDLFAELLS